MSRFIDPSTSEGQFYALVFLWMLTAALRVFGFEWAAHSHDALMAALLVLLRMAPPPVKSP